MDATLSAKGERLVETLRETGACLVALSGGVDSAVVAKAAFLALGERAVAVTGKSDALAEGELEFAEQVAERIGIRHVVISTQEIQKPGYVRNAPDRCYHCKSELYTQMLEVAPEHGTQLLVNGANADDLTDYRPGMQAAAESRVASPLAACGIGKQEVRQLARHWDLPIWDKPASPCLASRIAYGQEVTPERLQMIDRAEVWLKSAGFPIVRVRYHDGDLARVEVPAEDLPRLLSADVQPGLVTCFKELGFKFVTVDLEGFRSGNLNQLIPVEALTGRTGF